MCISQMRFCRKKMSTAALVCGGYRAQVQLKAINPANKSVANIQFSLFDKDLTQTQTLTKYFGRQTEGDQFPNITLKSAQVQPEQAFRVMVRHQPKND